MINETPEAQFILSHAKGLTRLSDRLWTADEAQLETYPEEVHASYAQIEETSFWFAHRNTMIGLAVDRFRPQGPIIDVGGGNGFVSRGLNARGYPTIVVEPGQGGVDTSLARGLNVIRGLFTPEMFTAGSAAAIGLFDVVEHIPDDLAFLKDCNRAIARDGYLYATVPAFEWLWSVDDDYARHCRRYTASSLRSVLEKAGFTVSYLTYFFSLLVPPLLVVRTIPSRFGLRRDIAGDKSTAEHRRTLLADVAERLLSFEQTCVRNNMTVPFGTSLLVVAKKNAG